TALTQERDSLCDRRDEAKIALEIASRLQREFSEADRKIEHLHSEKNALDRQLAAADERVAQLERELQTMHQQLAKEQTELAAFEAAQKEATVGEEELAETNNQLRLTVATERQRHETLITPREPMCARG